MSVHSRPQFFSITLLALFLTTGISVGQTITLSDLPAATGNDRFFLDRFSVIHPSFSAKSPFENYFLTPQNAEFRPERGQNAGISALMFVA